MAELVEIGGRRRFALDSHAHYLVGRRSDCSIRLSDGTVSAIHATIHWDGERWLVKDLSSSNGTVVDGMRLGDDAHQLRRGCLIVFGEAQWRVASVEPPVARAVSPSREAVEAAGGLLVLPSDDDPEVAIYRDSTGRWVLEREGTPTPVGDGLVVTADGSNWELMLPTPLPGTEEARTIQAVKLDGIELHFQVSGDEEHVTLALLQGGHRISLGESVNFYTLLHLARLRLRDAHMPPAEQGWIYTEQLASQLRLTEGGLRQQVLRIRRSISNAGVGDAAAIIGRRRNQYRLEVPPDRIREHGPGET